jgi:beta-N-acetylhexosaminidase
MRFFCIPAFCLLLLSACSGCGAARGAASGGGNEDKAIDSIVVNETTPALDPFKIRAAEIAASLDDRLLAAQVCICGIDGRGFLPAHMKTLLAECPAGGIVLFRYNLDTENGAIRSLIAETVSFIQDESGIPPFVSVDHEGGDVNRFLPGVARLPSAASYWELSTKDGKEEALEKIGTDSFEAGSVMNGLGVNLNFAPVAESLNDENRVFLGSRSYGPDPSFSAEAAAAFVRGMEQVGVLCAIKHFPGSAGEDPHRFPSVIKGDIDELVFPFTALIAAGARAVMVTHSAVPQLDSEIASLSPVIMGKWLREELGFDGIVICDDFSMTAAGSAKGEEAAIRSVAAGADMVLVWPPDIRRTHRAFLAALEDGRLPRERLQDAAERIILEKLRMGLLNGER